MFVVETDSAGHYEFDKYEYYWTCDNQNNLDIYEQNGGLCIATFARGQWLRVAVDD